MKLSRVRVAFQIVLHLVLAGHVIAYYAFGWTRIGAIDFQAFFHYFLGQGLLTAGAIFTLVMLAGALVFGRHFCSWGCHFGATQDLAAWILRRAGWKAPLLRTRFLHQTPWLILAVVFLLPLLSHWRESSWGPVRMDLAAVAPWDTLPGWFLSIVTFLACGAGLLFFLGTRGFCRFVCPYGAVFRVTDRVAPFRVRKVGSCGSRCGPEGVQPCTAACPTAIDVHLETERDGSVTSPDCVRCNLCIEACPSGALAHVTAGRAAERRRSAGVAAARDGASAAHVPATGGFRPLEVPIISGSPRLEASPAPYDLPFWEEAAVLAVAAGTYLAVDLVYGGHFLAAAIALGEGFLALSAIRAFRGDRSASILGLPLRIGRRWTLAGITVAGLFFLSAIPVAEAGAFRWLRADGLRHDTGAPAVAGAAFESPAPEPRLSAGAAGVTERDRLETAAARYRQALQLFPSHLQTRRLLLSAYARLGDSRAVEEAREIARRSPSGDPWSAEALRYVYRRFGVLEHVPPKS